MATDLIADIASAFDRQIAALQDQIKILEKKKDETISNLRKDLGEQVAKPVKGGTKTHHATKKSTTQQGGMSVRTRMVMALEKMPKIFKTAELFEAMNSDGGGTVLAAKAFKVFHAVRKQGFVAVESPRHGTEAGTYRWTGKKLSIDSSAEPDLF
jgi:hypothetical protein